MTVGKIHSFQSLGTVDGPGVRFVVFTQGCPLRCGCCHNPDTWAFDGGKEFTAEEVFLKVLRYREYFGTDGGITVSGGEPLMQADFVGELFSLCKKEKINTCLDTSGVVFNQSVDKLLSVTDRVLLDVKYTSRALYLKHVGCDYDRVIEFLKILCDKDIPTTLRQVIIPTLNDDLRSVKELKKVACEYKNVDKIELLPFKKICQVKYDEMKIDFPFKHIPTPTKEKMLELNEVVK
jgi:pyruvate formate lyase activating enzyme